MFCNFGIIVQLTDAWCNLFNNNASFEIIYYLEIYTTVSKGSLNHYWDELGDPIMLYIASTATKMQYHSGK